MLSAVVLLVLLTVPPVLSRPATVPPPTLGPRDRVVTPTGSDAAPGTVDAPWRTLQHAADTIEPGGTAWIRAGRYTGFRTARSGAPDAPITFAGWPGDAMPVLDGALDGRVDVVQLSSVHDIRIRGLTVTGAAGGTFSGSGILIENGSTRVEVTASLLTANQSFGVLAHTSTGVLIADNEISHNASGVRVSGSGEGTVIRGNRIHHTDRMLRNTATPTDDDAGGDAITLDGSTGALAVTGNRIWANRARSLDYGWDGGAFAIYGASNVSIMDNLVWDNENVLETGTDPGVPCTSNRFLRNVATGRPTEGRSFGIFLRCGTDMLVAHNTLRDLAFGFVVGADSASFSGPIDGLRILNNIVDLGASGGTVFGLVTPLPASVVIDYDLVRTSGLVATWTDGEAVDLAVFQARTGYEAHGRWSDPQFAGADDPELSPDSPAIDAGIPIPGVNDDATGAGPDQGARERPGG